MKALRAIFRLLYFAGFGIALIARVQVHFWWRGEDMHWSLRLRQRWTRRYLLPALGVRLRIEGQPPTGPCLVVGNHRSYIDPAVISTQVPGFPLSKAEVDRWPLVGRAIRYTGVLLVQRENATSRKDALAAIAAKLREGYPVILFPEGTTHADAQTREFRPGAFKTASDEGVPIVPVALDYRDPDAYWVDDDTFLPHFLRCFGKPYHDVIMHFGPPIRAANAEEAIATARQWIDEHLRLIRQNFSYT
jgi:1-acyl-sn-glycerol-3-phosphate acyltransferase